MAFICSILVITLVREDIQKERSVVALLVVHARDALAASWDSEG
jgi:hypothetical protein